MRSLRLRTKFLLSVLATTAGLSAATLAVVRYGIERQVRASMQDELRNSIRTYQSFARQREESLTRSAELLANLPNVRALMTTDDVPTIQDASANIWQLSGSDLLVLADRGGKLEALCGNSGFSREVAQAQLRESLQNAKSQDWWFGDGHLYQVSIQPIYFGPASQENLSGLLAVGHEVNGRTAADFAKIVAGEVVFGYDGTLVASTVPELPAGAKMQISGITSLDNPGAATELQMGSRHFLGTTVNLSADATRLVTFSVLKSLDQARAFMARLNRVLLLLGLLSFVAGSGLVFVISHTFTKPLSTLVEGVRAFERNDFAYPLESSGGDEVAEVTGAFARMRTSFQIARREHHQLEERLRQAHKMEAVGRLAGGVAHDFNNLLTIIRGNSDLLEDRPGADDFQRRCVEQIQKASGRAVSMTRQLLAFSRMQVLAPRVLDLNTIVNEMGKMLPRLIGEDIEYNFAAEPALAAVLADPGQVEQVILNLAVNARDAMPNGGKLTVRTANVTMDGAQAAQHPPMTAGKYVLLSVADTGHGMDEETKARIFEPFFTTKEVGKGTGLGLATVYGIVKQSGGFIWLESKPEQGARFEIYFPQTTKLSAPTAEEKSKRAVAGGDETILVVEDEAGVRELTCEFLNSAGYRVLQAHDGADAIEVAARYHGTIALLLTDMVMPRMGGRDLAERLRTGCPAMKVLFISGYAEYSEISKDQAVNEQRVLQKPFSRQQLLENVRTVLSEVASEPIVHASIGVPRIEGRP
jgi:signal transduction histidine kinase/CheY-like chemotaxis protein